jgi:hypothetical protein
VVFDALLWGGNEILEFAIDFCFNLRAELNQKSEQSDEVDKASNGDQADVFLALNHGH